MTKKGYRQTKEHKNKISQSLLGKKKKPFSEEHRRKISEANKGCIPWNKGKTYKGKPCKARKNRIILEKTKKKISKSLLGHKSFSNSRIGIMPQNMQKTGTQWGHVKSGYYNIDDKKMFFRSKMEANYALYLNFLVKYKQIKKWEYEPETFVFEKIKFGVRSYRPDFKVYNLDNTITYHETKGYMTSKSKTKIKRMAKYYKNINLIIIDNTIYQDIKKKLGKMLKFY